MFPGFSLSWNVDGKKKKKYDAIELIVVFLILAIAITAFGLSLKSYLVLNPADGEINFGSRNVVTDGNMFVNGGMLRVGEESINLISSDGINNITTGEESIILPPKIQFSENVTFDFPEQDGTAGDVLTTNGNGELSFEPPFSGLCYGVTTNGGLLLDGLSFGVVAGRNIAVSSEGVSLTSTLTGIEQIIMENDASIVSSSNIIFIKGKPKKTGAEAGQRAGTLELRSGEGVSINSNGNFVIRQGTAPKIVIDDRTDIKFYSDIVPNGIKDVGVHDNRWDKVHTNNLEFAGASIAVTRDGTSLKLVSNNTGFKLPGGDGSGGQVLSTDGAGNLVFSDASTGTCYGVVTNGGLELSGPGGTCFGVVAGDNIVVSSEGVSVDTNLIGIKSIEMNNSAVIDNDNASSSLRILSNTGKNILIAAGDNAEGTGGNIVLQTGQGNLPSNFGNLTLKRGNTEKISIENTGIRISDSLLPVSTSYESSRLGSDSQYWYQVYASKLSLTNTNSVETNESTNSLKFISNDTTFIFPASHGLNGESLVTNGIDSVNFTNPNPTVIWELSEEGTAPTNTYKFFQPEANYQSFNPTLYLIRGQTYKFRQDIPGKPLRIQTTPNGAVGPPYNDGITGQNMETGTLIFSVPLSGPSTLYYQNQSAGLNMGGAIYIRDNNLTGVDGVFFDGGCSIGNNGTSLNLVSNSTPFKFPGGDGTDGQVLTTNGSGSLSFTQTPSRRSIKTTLSPVLGGDKATNTITQPANTILTNVIFVVKTLFRSAAGTLKADFKRTSDLADLFTQREFSINAATGAGSNNVCAAGFVGALEPYTTASGGVGTETRGSLIATYTNYASNLIFVRVPTVTVYSYRTTETSYTPRILADGSTFAVSVPDAVTVILEYMDV